MSQWTHINGSIIVDGLGHGKLRGDLTHFLHDKFPKMGSEGPAEYHIEYIGYENGCGGSLRAFQVTFNGDLRDVGASSIEKFESFVREFEEKFWIRNIVFEIDVEFGETIIFYDGNYELQKLVVPYETNSELEE